MDYVKIIRFGASADNRALFVAVQIRLFVAVRVKMDKIYIAPLQGHTDAAYRHFHADVYGGDYTYYTPFMRVEKGEIREKDLREFTSELNANHHVIPQVIFKSAEELDILLKALTDTGASEIDLNMGCPFPLQTARGRGAATVANRELLSSLGEVLAKYPDVKFTAKMRLGYENPDEWKVNADIINELPLAHIVIHPRVARDQYKGEIRMGALKEFVESIKHPIIYNGEIHTPDDWERIKNEVPGLQGVMIGRGLLGRPSLANELNGESYTDKERLTKMLTLHRRLLDHYESVLCGDHQVLSKIGGFWEYAEPEIGRKAWKAISKAKTMPKYRSAMALIGK